MRRFEVIKEMPSAKDLMGFDYFPQVPVGTILEATNNSVALYWNGMNICDIDSTWCKVYLKEIK